jgi:hypothetical protein
MSTVPPALVTPKASVTFNVQMKSVAVFGIVPLAAESIPVFWLKESHAGRPVQPLVLAVLGAYDTSRMAAEPSATLPGGETCRLYGGVPPLIN